MLLNPPIVTLEPRKPQLMRLGLRHLSAEGDEIAYRLIVEEVPPAPKPGEIALRTILRISVPIFVEPTGGTQKQLDWRAEEVPGGIKITATNNGNSHVQVKHLDLSPEEAPNRRQSRKCWIISYRAKRATWTFEDEQFQAGQKLPLAVVTDAG